MSAARVKYEVVFIAMVLVLRISETGPNRKPPGEGQRVGPKNLDYY
jgi:hypothetical protein